MSQMHNNRVQIQIFEGLKNIITQMQNVHRINSHLNCRHNNSYRKIQRDATVYQNLLFHIYKKLNMFRATHGPSSGA
jgi:hypothetical protein